MKKDELSLEISESIAKNLPKMVGEELQKRLDMIPVLEKENEELKNAKQQMFETNYKMGIRIDQLENLKLESDKLEKLKLELDERARGFKVELLQLQLIETQKREQSVVDLTRVVFRSPVFTSSLTHSNSRNGTSPEGRFYNENHTETKHTTLGEI